MHVHCKHNLSIHSLRHVLPVGSSHCYFSRDGHKVGEGGTESDGERSIRV